VGSQGGVIEITKDEKDVHRAIARVRCVELGCGGLERQRKMERHCLNNPSQNVPTETRSTWGTEAKFRPQSVSSPFQMRVG
jgi:hypothetical protein